MVPLKSPFFLPLYRCDPSDQFASSIPIGQPFPNLKFSLRPLNTLDALSQHDNSGELLISGDQLANAYHNNPSKSASAFITEDSAPFTRWYQTGDLAKVENGSFYIIGRIDQQVKLNGQRVELQGIESVIRRAFNLQSVFVFVDSDSKGSEYISCVFLSGDAPSLPDNLTSILLPFLPSNHIPRKFYRISEFPYTASGKLDRKAILRLIDDGALSVFK